MPKIVFGITKLGIGGAERVLVDMVNTLCDKYDITIFTIYSGGELEKELNNKIKIVSIYRSTNKFIPIYALIFGKHIYNKYLRNKYDMDIAFLEGPVTRVFSYKGTAKKIAWIHNDINQVFGKSIKSKLKKTIDKYVYKKYDKIVFVSEDNKECFNKLYGNEFNQIIVKNYIDKNRVVEMSKEKIYDMQNIDNTKVILTIARLVKQKGIDRFIKIHKSLIDEGIMHKVYVIGDGEEKENLNDLIKMMNVQDSFILLGKRENPYPYIKKSDYFALLSYYEGYGMVIEEAKIFNKPIIITDTAAKEAVSGYEKYWILDNNEIDIYNGLKNIIGGIQG